MVSRVHELSASPHRNVTTILIKKDADAAKISQNGKNFAAIASPHSARL
jgi:hypothetical protein